MRSRGYNKTYYSPFEVNQEVIHYQGSFSMDHGTARIVTITGESKTQYRVGKMVFDKPTTETFSPSGRGDTNGSLKPITPELLEVVNKTIARDNAKLQTIQNEKDNNASDEAEYLAWIETSEGKAMELLQTDWIGAKININEYTNPLGRNIVYSLIGVGGRELASIRINQEPKSFMDISSELDRTEISFASFRANTNQTSLFRYMLDQAMEKAAEWDQDAGKIGLAVFDNTIQQSSIAIEKII